MIWPCYWDKKPGVWIFVFKRVMKRKRREVRLSRPGKVFVGLTLALGFAAVNTGNNVLFLLVSMMLSLMVLSGFVAMANIWRVDVVLQPQQILTAEQSGDVLLRVHNGRAWPLWLLELRLGASRQTVTRIGGRQEALVALRWCPDRRGQPPLPLLQMGSAFPFSFVWRGLQVNISDADLPWVAPAGGEDMAMTQNSGEQLPSSDRAGGQGDFLWIRNWRSGESLHQIIWRRVDWSRNLPGIMHFPGREQEKTGQEQVLLNWESPFWLAFPPEQRLRIFRAALDKAWNLGWSWQLLMPAGSKSGQGSAQREDALRMLAQHLPLPPSSAATEERGGWLRHWRFWQ
jgi:hypothetical protein